MENLNCFNEEVSTMIPEEIKINSIEEFDDIQKQYPDMKVEYYNSKIVLSSHTSPEHNIIVGNVFSGLKPFFRGSNCKIYHEQIEVILGYNTDDKEFVFPDIFVACDRKMKGASCIETPQIIFEVISPKYQDNDILRKLKLYQRHGVLEYIVVDPAAKDIAHYYMENGSFKLSIVDDYVSKVFDGLKLILEDIFEQ